jgi:hypothetical protein
MICARISGKSKVAWPITQCQVNWNDILHATVQQCTESFVQLMVKLTLTGKVRSFRFLFWNCQDTVTRIPD